MKGFSHSFHVKSKKMHFTIVSDYNVEIFVTHKNYATETSETKPLKLPHAWTKSPLNDSANNGILFNDTDVIKIAINVDVKTTMPFSVFFVLRNHGCLDYDVMTKMQCTTECIYTECQLELHELDTNHYQNGRIWCRFKCPTATKVYIRLMKKLDKKYLPSNLEILELAALGI